MPSKSKKTAKKKKASKGVSKEMTFAELTSKHPEAIPVLFEYGLHCIGCHVSAFETIEQGALMHGLTKEQVKEMISKINCKAKDNKPKKQ